MHTILALVLCKSIGVFFIQYRPLFVNCGCLPVVTRGCEVYRVLSNAGKQVVECERRGWWNRVIGHF